MERRIQKYHYRVEGVLQFVLSVPDHVRLLVQPGLHVVLHSVDAHPVLSVVDAVGGHRKRILSLLQSMLQLCP